MTWEPMVKLTISKDKYSDDMPEFAYMDIFETRQTHLGWHSTARPQPFR